MNWPVREDFGQQLEQILPDTDIVCPLLKMDHTRSQQLNCSRHVRKFVLRAMIQVPIKFSCEEFFSSICQ